MNEFFADVMLPKWVRDLYPPDKDALFNLLCSRIRPEMLAEIAAADYGEQYDEHLEALQSIVRERKLPSHLGWVPGEVLELIRWSDANDEHGHVKRAFACACLITHYAEDESDGAEEPTLIQLIDSCLFLDGILIEALLKLMTCRLGQIDPESDDFSFYAVGISAVLLKGRDHDGLPECLANWLVNLELTCRLWSEQHDWSDGSSFLNLKARYWTMRKEQWGGLVNLMAEAHPEQPSFADLARRIGARS